MCSKDYRAMIARRVVIRLISKRRSAAVVWFLSRVSLSVGTGGTGLVVE